MAENKKTYNSECIKEAVCKYGNMVFRIALCILGNRDDAEDAMQDTFLKYITKAPDFSDEEHEKAWLIRVSTNISKNMIIARLRRKTVSIDELADIGVAQEDKGVFDAIMELPVKYRIVMTLYYIEGYHVKEMADIISLSESAIRKRLQKGRELLKFEIERGNKYEI